MPLQDSTEPFDLILFGANGDLALRKLLPSLYHLHVDERLHIDGTIWLVSRSTQTLDTYLKKLKSKLTKEKFIDDLNEEHWQSFISCLRYVAMDLKENKSFLTLSKLFKKRNKRAFS